jgi:hypothetical protein
MAKDSFFLQHDINAQEDPKCIMLIEQLGMEGYGIFWALVERLRQEADHRLPFMILPPLSRRWNTSKEKLDAVVRNYSLFIFNETHFFSNRLSKDAGEFKDTKKLLSDAGKRGNEIRWGNRGAIRGESQINKVNKINKGVWGIFFDTEKREIHFSDNTFRAATEKELEQINNGKKVEKIKK